VNNLSASDVVFNSWTFNDITDTLIDTQNFLFPLNSLGANSVELIGSSNYENCVGTYQESIYIKPPFPEASFIASDSGCSPVTVSFINTSQDATSYLWDFGDGTNSIQEEPTHSYYDPGYYNVTLKVYNDTGEDSVTLYNTIRVFNSPNALYITNPSNGAELVAPVDVFFNNQSEFGTSYLWDFGNGDTSTLEQPLYSYTEEGEYYTSLTVTNEQGCTDSFNLVPPIIVINGGSFYIPNAFSPSLDGPSSTGNISEGENNNDIFFPKISGNVESYKMFIYDRWGELLFVSEDQEIGWDGYVDGQLAKQDVYVYRIEIQFETGESDVVLGDFSLIR